MSTKPKIREISLVEESGTFTTFFKKFSGEHKEEFNFEGLTALRHILSNQKAKLLHFIKTRNPTSVYSLAKLTGRDFKSVSNDIKVLERFGFIDLIAEKTGKRERLKPILTVKKVIIEVNI